MECGTRERLRTENHLFVSNGIDERSKRLTELKEKKPVDETWGNHRA